jgi:DNA polymerase III subunit delta
MKLQTRQIDGFLKSPDKSARAILVYGPDQGLVKERAKIIGLAVVTDLNDPFNAAHLTGELIEADSSRFFDEVNALSLMGGSRLIRITDVDNKFAVHLKDWLKSNPSEGSVVVIEGGALGPRDALRKHCEEAPNAIALPCYIPDERDIAQFIRDQIRDQGKSIENDAAIWLSRSLRGDRDVARMEIEKCCLYVGAEQNMITLSDVQASCGEIGNQGLDDLIEATFNRDPLRALLTFRRIMDEGTDIIVVERSLQNHVRRLHQVKIDVEENGQSVDLAMKKLQPPVFFKNEDKFKSQINKFSSPYLRKLLARLSEIEAETKKTGTPTKTLMADALLKLASI